MTSARKGAGPFESACKILASSRGVTPNVDRARATSANDVAPAIYDIGAGGFFRRVDLRLVDSRRCYHRAKGVGLYHGGLFLNADRERPLRNRDR